MSKETENKTVQVTKALNEELMQATFVVMVPDEPDAHGDVISVAEIRKACHNFNKHSLQANLFHVQHTDSFEFAESFISPVDLMIDDKFITKGTWLCVVQCLDNELWSLIKSGEICAVSVGCVAAVENIE